MSEIILSEGSVKLYEYEQFKPDLADVIEHHQALGAHWGIYNGPPYPLSRKLSTGKRLKPAAKGTDGGGGDDKIARKRSKALKKARKTRKHNIRMKTLEAKKQKKIQKTKDEIIKTKDIQAMLKNVDKFSNQEINDLLTRLDVESKLRTRVNAMNEANKSFIRKFLTAVRKDTTAGVVSAGRELVKRGSKEGFNIVTKKLLEELVDRNGQVGDGQNWGEVIDKIYNVNSSKSKKSKKPKKEA